MLIRVNLKCVYYCSISDDRALAYLFTHLININQHLKENYAETIHALERPEPLSSALDRSAMLPHVY